MRSLGLIRFVLCVCACLATFAVAEDQWTAIGPVRTVTPKSNGLELALGTGVLQVTALAPNVIRVRHTRNQAFGEDSSFAVIPNSFPNPPSVRVEQTQDAAELSTSALKVRVCRSPLRIVFLDLEGKIISQDTSAPAIRGSSFRVWKSMAMDEHYYGLGDKAGPLDHREQAFTMWNTDTFAWEESTDPMYKSFPFFLAVKKGNAYGIYLDNTYRSSFDLGKQREDELSFGAEGGDLNYYFFYGPQPKQVVSDFTQLTGRMPLPPLFTLGYQQSRYSYMSEAEVRDIAREFRERKIPNDVIYLDIDYEEGYAPFTINRKTFPNFEGMISDLRRDGFQVVAISDLHMKQQPGFKPYEDGLAGDHFLKNPDGSLYVAKVWPGQCVFPDFTRSATRAWYGTLYKDLVQAGVRGIWNDMNEPAIFESPNKTMPLDTIHRVEDRKTDHREIHNVYGMQNVRTTYDGLLKLRPEERPFVITRAAFAGTQRYSSSWTGDNIATWNHMRISVPILLNLGLSGFPWIGSDIGGFEGSPNPELLTRWMELGAFTPFYRNHAVKGSRYREPWVDGPEHEAIRRRFIETRYRLLPYVYTQMEATSRTGIPMMRPVFLEFPETDDPRVNGQEFMFGESLLVAPVLREFTRPYPAVLPKGEWFDYWTGEKIKGGTTLDVAPKLDNLPVFVRAGAILPQQPLLQSTSEVPQGSLELRVYPGPNCRGDLYQDDGNSFAYKQGHFARVHFTCEMNSAGLTLKGSSQEGDFHPWFTSIKAVIYDAPATTKEVKVNGAAVSGWTANKIAKTVSVGMLWSGAAFSLELR